MTGLTVALLALAARSRSVALGLAVALLAWPAVAAGPVGAAVRDRWQPHADVGLLDRVTLNVHWHDSVDALRAAAVGRGLGAVDLHGFSILRRNTETGEWVCDVFVVKMRGALVDNDRTVTFGHEVLHCFGFRHED
jgi:hypothetical protein